MPNWHQSGCTQQKEQLLLYLATVSWVPLSDWLGKIGTVPRGRSITFTSTEWLTEHLRRSSLYYRSCNCLQEQCRPCSSILFTTNFPLQTIPTIVNICPLELGTNLCLQVHQLQLSANDHFNAHTPLKHLLDCLKRKSRKCTFLACSWNTLIRYKPF